MECPFCRSPVADTAAGCRACGALLAIGPGSVVAGRFEILGRLGRGGMGNVFEAVDRQLHERFALKVVVLGREPQALKRFHSEVRLARKVKHRNVCGVYDYGEDGEIVYCSMELVRGHNLRELLQRAPLSRERAFEIALAAAAGLQAIHEAGVIHRDVKAANVMLDESNEVRIVDFGIAKPRPDGNASSHGTDSAVTDEQHVIGSPEYMSPEQVRGAALDVRSDVYSFGIVLYELFTGRVPFRDTTPLGVMLKQVQEAPRLDGPLADLLPDALVPVLRRALAKDPGQRQASMAELAHELRAARRAGASSTDPLESPTRFRLSDPHSGFSRLVGQERAAAWMTRAAVVGMMLLAAGIVGYAVWPTAPVRSSVATRPPASPQPQVLLSPERPVPSPIAATSAALPRAARRAADPAARTARQPAPKPPAQSPATGAAVARADDPGLPEAAAATTSTTAPATIPTTTMPPATTLSATSPTTTTPATMPTTTTTTTTLARAPAFLAADCSGQKVAYSGVAEALGAQGLVVVAFTVAPDGRVGSPRILRSADGVLNDSALRSVSRWRCRPATLDGQPVASEVELPLRFELPRGR